ncbi:MAG: hypothetical protein AAGM22_31380 [Acidobacteriota bacterium]
MNKVESSTWAVAIRLSKEHLFVFTVVPGMTTSRRFPSSPGGSPSPPEDAAGRNSCLLCLVIYAVLSVVYSLVLQRAVEGGAAIALAMVMAIFGTLFLASAISAVVWPGEVRWLRAAMRGEWPEDGSICAVHGRLDGPRRPAPISEEPAVAWAVEVSTRHVSSVHNRKYKVLKLKGLARTPATLEGPAGSVRLSGLLQMNDVKPRRWKAWEVMSEVLSVRNKSAAEPFSESLAGPGDALDDFATPGDDFELVRFNHKYRIEPGDDVDERLLKAGQDVCAFGVFDRRTGTLTGRRVLGVERIDVMVGGPRRVAARLMRKTWLGLAAMAILFVLSHGLVGAVVFLM